MRWDGGLIATFRRKDLRVLAGNVQTTDVNYKSLEGNIIYELTSLIQFPPIIYTWSI